MTARSSGPRARARDGASGRPPRTRLFLGALWIALAALVLPAAGRAAPRGEETRVRRAPAHKVLPFIADDYTRAVAEARARRVPLFVEAWAPW